MFVKIKKYKVYRILLSLDELLLAKETVPECDQDGLSFGEPSTSHHRYKRGAENPDQPEIKIENPELTPIK